MNKYLLIFGLLLLSSYSVHSQDAICDGNLGDNIFVDGDFGTGIANSPDQPDNIITTYSYVQQTPPSDGSFTITNNMGAWSNLFGTWLPLEDNSNDPNGYFMVVNADFTPGIMYEEIINDLCENTLYVFTADVINVVRRGVLDHIPPNVSFLLDEVEQYSTGEIQQDETWRTFGFTFTTGPGVTSMKLSLRNNAPGGIGNDLAIDNITFRACGPRAEILPIEIANICEDGDPLTINATITGDQFDNESIQWQQSFDEGLTWENIAGSRSRTFQHTERSAGFYYYRYLVANSPENINNSKCRINSNVKIIRVVPKFREIVEEICEGLSFEVGNNNYTTSGIFVDSLISSLGCDSIVTLQLTVTPDACIEAIVKESNPSCATYQDGTIEVVELMNARSPFSISIDSLIANEATTFQNLPEGDYQIIIEDDIGCRFEEDIRLVDPVAFNVDLEERIIVDLGNEVVLNTNTNFPITSSEWFPSVLDCPDCETLSFIPTNSQVYRFTAFNEAGCEASDSIFVIVQPARNIFIPDVFSPNGDGVNDFFSIHLSTPNVQLIREALIFDRWGNLVFEASDLFPELDLELWNGSFNGRIAAEGVYVYAFKILFLDGEEETMSGDVLLIK